MTWASRIVWRSGVGDVAAHEVLDVVDGAVEPPHEGVDGALAHRRPSPVGSRRLVLDVLREELHELAERPHLAAFDLDAAVAERLGVLQPRGDVVDHDGVLLAVVLGVGEAGTAAGCRGRTRGAVQK